MEIELAVNYQHQKRLNQQKLLLSFQGNNSIGRKDLDKINPYFSVQGMSAESKKIVDDTNKMMEQLGFTNYKVSGAQVESVTAGVNKTVLPGMQSAENGAVAANLTSVPKGDLAGEEFSKLFALG